MLPQQMPSGQSNAHLILRTEGARDSFTTQMGFRCSNKNATGQEFRNGLQKKQNLLQPWSNSADLEEINC